MSENTNNTADDTFVSAYSGERFPESDRREIPGYGPVANSEISDNLDDFFVAEDDGETYHVSQGREGLDEGFNTILVSPDCEWELDPDGRYIHPDASMDVYVAGPRGAPATREWGFCHRDDPRAYEDDYDNERYWSDHFSQRTSRDYDPISSYNRHHHFASCECCGDVFPVNELDNDGYCESCAEERDDDLDEHSDAHGPITSYGNRSYPPERGRGPVRAGVELEVEVRSGYSRGSLAADVAAACHDSEGRFVILKEDGSLDNGFEIVSAPMSLDVHKTVWDKFFNRVSDGTLSGLKAWTATTAGMHVHISRDPLSCYQVGKVVVFVNAAPNAEFIRAIAGRDSSYAKFVSGAKVTHGSKGFGGDRYCSVNLCNSHTIEFRIFRSSLNRARFLANIQFCFALVAYCAPCARSLPEAIDHKAFIKWVRTHRKSYPDLDALLVRKGYLDPVRTGKTTVAEIVTVDSD